MKEHLQQLAIKTLDNMASVKFYILVSATVFFAFGRLSEGTWQETVLIVAGLRAVNEVTAMVQAGKKAKTEKAES